MEILRSKGAVVSYSDPHVPRFPKMRHHKFELESVALDASSLSEFDAVMLATNHAEFDYDLIAASARLIVDTRGCFRTPSSNVVKA